MTFVPLWKQPEADNVNFHFITFVNVNDQVHELGRLALALHCATCRITHFQLMKYGLLNTFSLFYL